MRLDEILHYPVRSFTYSNEQVRADEVPRVIVYNDNVAEVAIILGTRPVVTWTV
jgi:hypothetical protein